MDLISRAALRKAMYYEAFETDTKDQRWDSGCWIRYKMFERNLEAVPTVEAVPVVHGKWIMKDSGLWQECSVCGVAVEVDSMYMCKASEDMNFNYCPHCGAKMEGLNERSD